MIVVVTPGVVQPRDPGPMHCLASMEVPFELWEVASVERKEVPMRYHGVPSLVYA